MKWKFSLSTFIATTLAMGIAHGANEAQLSLSTSYKQTLDEYADPYFVMGIGGRFKLDSLPDWGVGLSTAVTQPTDPVVLDESYYGITDLSVSLSKSSSLIEDKDYGSLTPSFSVGLPTSERSQLASLIVSSSGNLSWSKPLTDYLGVGIGLGINANAYQFETGNKAGSIRNSPFSYNYSFSGQLSPLKMISLGASYARVHRMDYDNYWSTIQSVGANISAVLNTNVTAYVSYSWRDRDYSSDPIFDLGKTDFGTGLTITY